MVANWVEKFQTHRITMSYPVLNAAAEVLFLVTGDDKAWALREVLREARRWRRSPPGE